MAGSEPGQVASVHFRVANPPDANTFLMQEYFSDEGDSDDLHAEQAAYEDQDQRLDNQRAHRPSALTPTVTQLMKVRPKTCALQLNSQSFLLTFRHVAFRCCPRAIAEQAREVERDRAEKEAGGGAQVP